MATYVTLVNLTDQGIRNVKDSPARFEAFKTLLESLGGSVKCAYWTMGSYDMVVIMEGEEEALLASSLKVASLGNVRLQTLRGFSVDEMKNLVSKIPG